jgi:hypothetical protein
MRWTPISRNWHWTSWSGSPQTLLPPGEYVGDAVRESAGLREYVFVHVIVDANRRTVTAIGVGYTSRPVTA